MADDFLLRFARKIWIDADPEVFTFRSGQKTLQLHTFVYLHIDKPRGAVAGVGEHIVEPGVVRVDLFGEHRWPFEDGSRMEAFAVFLRFGISRLTSRFALIRPVVVFRNVCLFDEMFHGYQESVFRDAAGTAGASWVDFDRTG